MPHIGMRAGADEHIRDHEGKGVSEVAPKALFSAQLQALRSMAFEDKHRNLVSLLRAGSDIDAAVVRLLRE